MDCLKERCAALSSSTMRSNATTKTRRHEEKRSVRVFVPSWLPLRVGLRQSLEDRLQAVLGRREILGQHARVADRGHEVRVAVPPWHEMHVQVIDDAGTGGPA